MNKSYLNVFLIFFSEKFTVVNRSSDIENNTLKSKKIFDLFRHLAPPGGVKADFSQGLFLTLGGAL